MTLPVTRQFFMTQKKNCFLQSSTVAENLQTDQGKKDFGAVLESEAKYRGFIENLSVMFYAVEPLPPYAPIYISPAFEQFGYPLEDWHGNLDLWTRILHDADRERILNKISAALESGKETDFEYRLIAKNGDVHWVSDRGSFVRDDKGNIVCWQGIILDITERKLGEQKLQHSEKLYRTLAQTIPQSAVIIFDLDLRYTLAEGGLLKKHGYSKEMLEGKTLYEVFPAAISKKWAKHYRRALKGETVELKQETISGCYQIYVVPVRDETGKIFAGMVMWNDITTQRAFENILLESEKRYRDLSEKSLGFICTHDLKGKLLSINSAAAKNLGYEPEELIGRQMQLLVAPAESEFFEVYLDRIKTDGEFFGSFRVLAKDGKERILRFSNTLYKEAGKQPYVLGSAQDITKLKRAELELRALFEAMSDIIIVLDKNGLFLKIAPTKSKLLCQPPEELIGKTLDEIFTAEKAEELLKLIQLSLETNQTQKLECMLPVGEREIWIVATVSPMTADTVIFVARNITEKKHAEQELQASSTLLSGLIEGTPDAVFVKDLDGRYLMINALGAEFAGITTKDFIGRTDAEIYPDSTAKQFTDADELVLVSGKTHTFEGLANAADGSVHTYLVTKAAYRNPQGEVVGLIGISHDITERKRAEEALRESEIRYRALFENANDLIYVHDLGGNYLSINKATERVFGYTYEEALKMNWRQVVVPEQLNRARRMLADKLAGSWQTAYEIDCIAKNGRRVTLEVNSSAIYKNGVPVAIQGIARDITERKQTEAALKESEEQYRDLIENANDLIYTHDLRGNFTSLNRAGESITGYSRNEALRMNIAQVVAPDFLDAARVMIANKIAGETAMTYELEIVAKQGNRVSLELSSRVIYQRGKPIGIQGIGRDITERKRVESSLINSERLYRLLGEGIMHQIWTAYPDGKFGYFNGRALEYLGSTSEQMQNESWDSAIHPEDLPECREKWTHSLETGEDYEVEFRLRRNDGIYRWFHARATAGHDGEGKVIIWFGTNTDIDDQKLAEAKLNHIAGHDTLTNLPNRARFMDHLERAVNRTKLSPTYRFAVLFLDLDRFKVINDSLGHTTGDKLLVALAKRLEECVRPNDIVARLGGDEFTILLNNVNESADAVTVANRLLQKFTEPFNLDSYEVFTSASIGIIISDEVLRQPEDFLRDADTAMYRAKAAGKSRYEIFDREMHIRNMNLLQLENDLRRAIEQNEFRVFYQPIIELGTGEIHEFEALIRWQHPQYGLVMPNDFIGIAEETGLIIPIGRWILEESCRQTAEWQKILGLKDSLSISVNLSAKQLMHPKLIEQVGEILAKTKLNSKCLKLEVTESMVMENSEKALSVISELIKQGISLSTDDFGTGYSSLSYLHRFPFNRLKIDRSFVGKMDTDQKSEAIVRTILLLGQNLNIEVVAEGIETEAQLESLLSLGCQIGQGFLFSKPVNAETAVCLLGDSLLNNNIPFYEKMGGHDVVEVSKIQ